MSGERFPRLVWFPLAAWEREGLSAALAKAGLPTEDVKAPGPLFWRFENDDFPVGFGGLEIHGDQALLRSVMTLPPLRERGIGGAIVAALEAEASLRGCRAIWLLAPATDDFFVRRGYARCERAEAPRAIQATQQFTTPSQASAIPMMKRLD